ncbi:MAG: SDR family NAD(P)-dependent oxidoreductase [Hymenobacter sp.]|nr:SDR family NAD(P)-dependent oxidoreductase [Hymenobacter sp.]
MELRNHTILITGGTSGFGYEFARQLLALGNTVLITGRNPAKLADTKRRLPQVHTFQSDVSDPAAIQRLAEQVGKQFPGLNVLINNAGEMRKLNLQDPATDLLDLTREIDTNLAGPIRMVQQFLPQLRAQKTAAILNVTSGLALTPYPVCPVYGATKAGLRSYTQSLRVQLQATNVKVFELVAPSAKTPLSEQFAADFKDSGVKESDLMAPDRVVAQALQSMQRDAWEVFPGMATALRYLSRLAPGFLVKQLSKGLTEALAQPQATAKAKAAG